MCRSSARFEFKTDFKPGLSFTDGQSMPLNGTGHLLTYDLNPFTGLVSIQYPLSNRGLSYLSESWRYAQMTSFFDYLLDEPGFIAGGTSLMALCADMDLFGLEVSSQGLKRRIFDFEGC